MKFYLMISIFLVNISAGVLDFKTISCNFVQTITNDENSTITYTGNFLATNQKQALWIYKTPVKKKVYFKDKKVAIIEPELEQAIITTLKNSPNITQIIKNATKISNNRYKTVFDDTNYFINIKNGEISTITYKDKLENKIKITLKNVEKNIILDDSIFKLKIPKNFDIVTQ
ncbi:MAG: outer membrane lipoprotein chaperone LolA [Epsilonproteobacteria bacterium]|nr:outer membrane lipoprotein chaperone LolA [Campylobacterota bacterium]